VAQVGSTSQVYSRVFIYFFEWLLNQSNVATWLFLLEEGGAFDGASS